MHKTLIATAMASMIAVGLPIVSPALAQEAPAAKPAHYSVATTPAGTLIDDPAAAAILKKLIPTVWANDMFHSMGRGVPLKGIQQYEPALTDEKLAEIQAELDKLPAKE